MKVFFLVAAMTLPLWIEAAHQADTCAVVPGGVYCYYGGSYAFLAPDSARITELFNLRAGAIYDVYQDGTLSGSRQADGSGAVYVVSFEAGSFVVAPRSLTTRTSVPATLPPAGRRRGFGCAP